jgi:hypothetical protein
MLKNSFRRNFEKLFFILSFAKYFAKNFDAILTIFILENIIFFENKLVPRPKNWINFKK